MKTPALPAALLSVLLAGCAHAPRRDGKSLVVERIFEHRPDGKP